MRGLLRRRVKAITDAVERHRWDRAKIFHLTQKINAAYEILKAEVKGTVEHVIRSPRWREKDVRSYATAFSSGLVLGMGKYRAPERGQSVTKTVHVDHFFGDAGGLFLAVYQGYNGGYVASLCARVLHEEVREHFPESTGNRERIKMAFRKAFRKIDQIQLLAEGEHPWKRWSGCSAVTCLVVSETLYVANEGNVRGFLLRHDNTVRHVTTTHDLYNRRERSRVRRNRGVVVKTERCALVNGVLGTTRGIGNQGDRRLKACVVNRPRFRAVDLNPSDKLLVLATRGIFDVFAVGDVIFLVRKLVRDALCKRKYSAERLAVARKPLERMYLAAPAIFRRDAEYEAFLRRRHASPVDARVPCAVRWNPDNPTIFVRRAKSAERNEESGERDAEVTEEGNSGKCYFTDVEQDDEELQELAELVRCYNTKSTYARVDLARLLSRRLIKSALWAGATTDNVVVVLLLKGFDVEECRLGDI